MEEEKNYKLGFNWKNIFIKVALLILVIILIIWLIPNKNSNLLYDAIFNNNIQTMKEAARNYYTIDKLPLNVGETSKLTLQEMLDKHMLLEFRDKDNKTCSTTDSYVQVTKTSEKEYVLKVQLSCGKQVDYILDTIGCYDVCVDGNCTTIIEPTENEIEYEFKQPVTNGYTCPSGYTLNGTKCYKNGSQSINATISYKNEQKIENAIKNDSGSYVVYADPLTKNGNLKCPTGYTSNGTNCVKNYNATILSSSGQFTCDNGYTLSGTKCFKSYAATYNSGSATYTCPSGYTRSGTTCYKSYTASYQNGTSSYYCPHGGTLQGTNCIYTASYKAGTTKYTCPYGNIDGTNCVYPVSTSGGSTSYYCPYGTPSGSNCIYKATNNPTYGAWYVVETYYGPNIMTTYSNNTEKLVFDSAKTEFTCKPSTSNCQEMATFYHYTKWRRSINNNYTCPSYGAKSDGKGNCIYPKAKTTSGGGQYCPKGGNISGNNCVYPATKTTSGGTYYCPYTGSLDSTGKRCTYNASKSNGTGKYYCPNGGTLNGKTCVISTPATKKSGSGSYTCPQGGNISGSTCIISVNAKRGNSSTVLSCPYGGTLSGSKCTNYLDGVGTTVYYCPNGYTTSGSGANTKCYKKVTSNSSYYCKNGNATLKDGKCYVTVKTISGYTCPNGYSLNGTKCVKGSTTTINATLNNGTSYKYTWSKQSYLEGWTPTGKTRTVAITNDGK